MKPKLIIGGTSKSGTTALYYYLRQHPDMCLSAKKELHFFSRHWLEQSAAGPGDRYVLAEIPEAFEEYLEYFSHCDESKIAVDISPSYLFYYQSANEIKKQLSDAKLVFILRNPADKVFSQYMHLVGEGRETLSFSEALEAENERKSKGYSDMWLYRESGFYSDAIEYFQLVLGKTNVKVFYHEEFLRDPAFVLREICVFAGVDDGVEFSPVSGVNRSGIPKSAFIAKLIAPNPLTYLLRRMLPQGLGRVVRKILRDFNAGKKPVLSKELRLALMAEFSDDIRKLELLVGRSNSWKK